MKLHVRVPPSYLAILIVLVVLGVFVLGSTLGWLRYQSVFFHALGFIIGWFGLITLGLIGAFFLGMLWGHRILSIGSFTPFEEEMIRMREDIKQIVEILEESSVGKTNDNDSKED